MVEAVERQPLHLAALSENFSRYGYLWSARCCEFIRISCAACDDSETDAQSDCPELYQ